jgi:putative ABC transport system substrate-binding protein
MVIDIGRREFMSALGGAVALAGEAAMIVWPKRVLAQASGETPRIAILLVGDEADPESGAFIAAFEQGMRAAGWTAGVNARLDYRWAGTDLQQIAAVAAEVASRNPTVIVTVGSVVTVAMHRATATIPIVFAVVSDPVGQGLVSSLARPGDNITGFSNFEPGIIGKWLGLLKEIVPHTTRVAVMFNPATAPYNELFFQRSIENITRSFNVEVMRAPVHDDGEIEAVIERLTAAPNGALLVPSDSFTFFRSPMIVALATKNRLPAIYAFRRFVADGGLVDYGVDPYDQIRSAASYADRIIKGAKPGNLPVQQPTKYTLVINLKTAKALGLEISPSVLALADEVIE